MFKAHENSCGTVMKRGKEIMKQKYANKKRKETLTAYLMLSPNIVGIGIFVFIPMLYAVYVSFHSWNGMSDMTFTGVDNYRRLITDTDFLNSVKTTLIYAVTYIPLVYCISLGLALITNSLRGKLETFCRMAYFMPYSISTVVAALIWSFMYDPKRGYFNGILNALGIKSQNFLADTDQALFAVMAVSVWLIVGYNMVIFIAAIKDVPQSLYEAADMDGANAVVKFFCITLPTIKNTTVFILVVTTIGSFQVFDQISIMTGGGPAHSTEVAVFRIYDEAFRMYDFGYSSTMAVALFVVIMILTFIQFKFTGSKED